MNAEQIRELRKQLGMTQHELADVVHVDQVTINRWENEKMKPSKLALERLEWVAQNIPAKIKEPTAGNIMSGGETR